MLAAGARHPVIFLQKQGKQGARGGMGPPSRRCYTDAAGRKDRAMKSLWSDADAEAMVAHYGAAGVSRRFGAARLHLAAARRRAALVLHGGGNTSVKTVLRRPRRRPVEVLCVKGSGWDMGNIEPPGLPAVRLAPIRRLRDRDALSDEDMVRVPARQPDRPGVAEPVGRDLAARLLAAQIHRPHPRRRRC